MFQDTPIPHYKSKVLEIVLKAGQRLETQELERITNILEDEGAPNRFAAAKILELVAQVQKLREKTVKVLIETIKNLLLLNQYFLLLSTP